MSYTYDYPRPAVTADAVMFKIIKQKTHQVLLIKRANNPYKDMWALPGGFIDTNETLEECVARELEEETGIKNIELYQLSAFSEINRDPRQRTITIAFYGFCKNNQDLKAGSDARKAEWFDIDKLPDLAFDHHKIIQTALKVAFAR